MSGRWRNDIKKMRLYILLIASLNFVYSQTNRPSAQIDADISEFNLEGQVKVITNNISYEAAGIEQKYFDFYKKFGQTYGFELGSLNTSASTNIYTKVMRDICRLISSLRYIDGVDYRTKVSRTVNIFKQKHYTSILNDIDELKSAVDKKPAAIKCWNKSKPQIANGVNSFLEKIQGEITTAFKELEPKVDDSLTGMQVEIEKIADEVEAAGTDDFDLTIYVT